MKPLPNVTESIQKIQGLHGNMAVLSRLDAILRDYNADLSDAERLILSDGALAASVIKISNSVLYSRGDSNRTLHAAIQQVGFKQILKLVGMALSKQVFMKDLSAYGISADQYWFSSFFTALFMETEAKRIGLNHEDAYLIGLLHAIGKVVINELLRDNAVEIYWDPSIPAEAWEEVMVGFSYNRAGAILLESWEFPQSIFRAVENQTDAVSRAQQPLLAMLDFAQCLVAANPVGKPLENWTLHPDHPYFSRYELTAESLNSTIGKLLQTIQQVRGALLHL